MRILSVGRQGGKTHYLLTLLAVNPNHRLIVASASMRDALRGRVRNGSYACLSHQIVTLDGAIREVKSNGEWYGDHYVDDLDLVLGFNYGFVPKIVSLSEAVVVDRTIPRVDQ